jgi:hypothetical protein
MATEDDRRESGAAKALLSWGNMHGSSSACGVILNLGSAIW